MTKILVVNDDGPCSKYHLLLCEKLIERNFDIISVTPKVNCSGFSGAITLNKEMCYEKVNSDSYVLMGTPIDAVTFGTLICLIEGNKIDAIISGINPGLNYGSTNLYSGTFMAAMEGLNHVRTCIAASFEGDSNEIYEYIDIIIALLDFTLKYEKKTTLYNLNYYFFEKNGKIFEENKLISENFIFLNPSLVSKDKILISSNNNLTEEAFLSIGRYKKNLFQPLKFDELAFEEIKRVIKSRE